MAIDEVEILLVEDNPRDAELTLRALRERRLANRLVHVTDGQQAIEWLFPSGQGGGGTAVTPPKIVLLDLKLPKVDGLEVLRRIRADPRTQLVPVVVLTSSQHETDVVESYKLGVNSYIVKAVDSEEFASALAEAGHYWLLVNQGPPVT